MQKINIDELLKGYDDICDLLSSTTEKTNAMDKISFGTFCCMITEEFCKAHSLDVVGFSQWLADSIKMLNKDYGRY